MLFRSRPDTTVAAIKLFGVVELKANGITEKVLASGRSAYWARKDDLLLVSTSRAELEGILVWAGAPRSATCSPNFH